MTTVPCQAAPEQWYSEDARAIAAAKAACVDCPARLACLQAAIDGDERFGIWGGLTPKERELLGVDTRDWPTCALAGCDDPVPPSRTAKPRQFCTNLHAQAAARYRHRQKEAS